MRASKDSQACCHGDSGPKKGKWFQRPAVFWAVVFIIAWGVSHFFPFLHSFRQALDEYSLKMLVPMLLGLFLGGIIDYYVPPEYISKYLASKRKRTVFYATGLGFLMSACSHGIIALSMELHKKGASGPAVVSFLLASPWANLPITFLLVGFFGWKGILIVFLALLISLNTGFFFQFLDHHGWIEKNRHSVTVHRDFSILQDLRARIGRHRIGLADLKGIGKGILELADMVLMWLVIGILLAGLAAAFIPMDVFRDYFGPSLRGLFFTLLAATLMEVCSEGTAPLAFAIYRQTGALGNAFAFLMGGVVTDYTEIGLVWKNLGCRTALWMLGVTLPQVFFFGWLLNHL